MQDMVGQREFELSGVAWIAHRQRMQVPMVAGRQQFCQDLVSGNDIGYLKAKTLDGAVLFFPVRFGLDPQERDVYFGSYVSETAVED